MNNNFSPLIVCWANKGIRLEITHHMAQLSRNFNLFFSSSRPRTGTHFTPFQPSNTLQRIYNISWNLRGWKQEETTQGANLKKNIMEKKKKFMANISTFHIRVELSREMRCDAWIVVEEGRISGARPDLVVENIKTKEVFFCRCSSESIVNFHSHSEQCSRRTPIMSCWLTTCEMPSRCFFFKYFFFAYL